MEEVEKLNKLVEFLNIKTLRRNSLCCVAMDDLDDETIEKLLKSYNGNSYMDARNAEDILKQYADVDVTGENEYISDYIKVKTTEYDFRRYTILKVIIEDQERAFILTAFPEDLAAIMVLEDRTTYNEKTIGLAVECLRN